MKGNYTLVGVDGNAYAVMAYVRRAMKECGRNKSEIDAYINDATSSNYDNLIAVSMDMLDILNDECMDNDEDELDYPSYEEVDELDESDDFLDRF